MIWEEMSYNAPKLTQRQRLELERYDIQPFLTEDEKEQEKHEFNKTNSYLLYRY